MSTPHNLIEFGRRLYRARTMAGKTQEQVASVMGVHTTMIGHYENARKVSKMPPYDVLLVAAEYLNVDHDWLGTGYEAAPPPKPIEPMSIDEIANFIWDRPQYKNPRLSDLVELIRLAEARYQ